MGDGKAEMGNGKAEGFQAFWGVPFPTSDFVLPICPRLEG